MGRIILEEVGSLQGLHIENNGCGAAAWGAVTHLAIGAGAVYDQGKLVLEVGPFRSIIQRLAQVCLNEGIQVLYDPAAQRLLEQHLAEVRALTELRKNGRPYTANEALHQVEANLRWHPPNPLTSQQLRNTAHLLGMHHGANFSVPGAGKTRTTLAVYAALSARRMVTRLLIVGPKNAFRAWEEEVDKCLLHAHVTRLTGGRASVARILAGNPEVCIVTYQLLPHVLDMVTAWMRRGQTHVILDEAHRIKGGKDAALAQAALRLSALAVRRDILTGTPMPQSIEDLVPQMEFLWPGQRVIPVREPHDTYRERVQHAVRPLYVRTTKGELGLPAPKILTVEVPLGPLQHAIYQAMRSNAREHLESLDRIDRRKFIALGRQTVRLLQVASNPALLTRSDINFDLEPLAIPPGSRLWELCEEYARYERPAKVWAAINRARALAAEGRKTVIWSSFVSNIEAIAEHLASLGAVFIHGQVPSSEFGEPDTREGRIQRFHEDPNCWVLVANPAAAGEGISLHKVCHHAIYVDRTFNAAHYLQSLDRIHRLGLLPDTATTVEVLCAPGTVDEAVEQGMGRKIQAMAQVLNDPQLAQLAYDPEDIQDPIPGGLDRRDAGVVIEHLTGDEIR